MNKKAKADTGTIIVIGIIALIALSYFGILKIPTASTAGGASASGTTEGQQVDCSQNPSYAFIGWDGNNGAEVGITKYLKVNGNPASTTVTNPTAGLSYELFASNASKFCEKVTGTGACGAQSVKINCYTNSTSNSVKVYDVANAQFLTASGGANNLTMGANNLANFRLDIQGTAKQSIAPLGGCIAIEYPTTVSLNSFNGLQAGCPYQWTYALQATTDTYKLFTLPAGWDKDGLGDIKSFSGSFLAGSSDPSALFYVTLQPAQHYVANDGNIYLDIEKAKNADTTKTFGSNGANSFKIQ